MELLALVLVVVAIFVGQGKGIALWLAGSIALIILSNHQGEMVAAYRDHQLPIILFAMVVPAIAIMISRWWGLLFYIVGSVLMVLATQIH